MSIPPLRMWEPPQPGGDKWNGALRLNESGIVEAVYDDGTSCSAGCLVRFRENGLIERVPHVSTSLGFQLDEVGRIKLSGEPSPPDVVRCEFRPAKQGEWYWWGISWLRADGDFPADTLVAVATGYTTEPPAPPGCAVPKGGAA